MCEPHCLILAATSSSQLAYVGTCKYDVIRKTGNT